MSTADTLLPAEVDEVPNQPSMSESLEEKEVANAAQDIGEETSGQAAAEHQAYHHHETSGTSMLSSPVVLAISGLPAEETDAMPTHEDAHQDQQVHYESFNYGEAPGPLPVATDQVMKDAGTGLSTAVHDSNAEGMNLTHEVEHPSEQELQSMEQHPSEQEMQSMEQHSSEQELQAMEQHPSEQEMQAMEQHPSEQEMRAMEHAVMAEVPIAGDSAMNPPPTKKRRTGSKRSSVRPWNDMLYELLKYRMTHKHVMVPFKTGGDLGKWVSQQRTQYANVQKAMREKPMQALTNSEFLTDERMRVLSSIGFVWDVVQADNDARWKKRYDELKSYRNAHGHCNVPQSTDLGKWVKMQRENKHEADLKKTGATPLRKKPKPCLSDDRIAKLEAIGFQWRVAKPAVGWDKRYQQLIEYKKSHGDCNVPQSFPPDKPFGRWVMKQRCQHSLKLRGEKSQLTDDREEKLNSIGFSWVAPGFSKKTVTMPGEDEDMTELQAAQAAAQAGAAEEQELYGQHPAMHHHPHADFTWTV